jgi:CRISPR-associated protein Cmr2
MTNNINILWQTKLAARLHDPAEKALVLLRDPAGHENGTSKALSRLLGLKQLDQDMIDGDNDEALIRTLFPKGVERAIYSHIQRADWWAAAADRPQWPMHEITVQTKKGEIKAINIAEGSRVNFSKDPVLIHPLSGAEFKLAPMSDTEINDIKARTFDHVAGLLVKCSKEEGEEKNWKKLLLTLWRFAPDVAETQDNSTIGELWNLLPADTRVPDHSIWDHLDLTSAFAGAFAMDPHAEASLLTLSLGPVQSFIAAARTTSDLWAGSHLLSRLAWEAMRPICDELGPDAILFPRLRGVPQVDLWLRDQGVPSDLFESQEWNKRGSDDNPLFSAALPNRFVAIVPTSQVRQLAERCVKSVREWFLSLGEATVNELLRVAEIEVGGDCPAFQQMQEQLNGFPEVNWASTPFGLVNPRDKSKQRDLDVTELKAAMAPFYGSAPNKDSGFLATRAWQQLQTDLNWDSNTVFFQPNPGLLYPAIYDLTERALASAKAANPFTASSQTGWRCSLTGEAEWLTTDREQLKLSPGQREKQKTLWAEVAKLKPAWAKKGEHLGALSAVKRVWPSLFAQEVTNELGQENQVSRFVVSTHTMSLAHQLDGALLKSSRDNNDWRSVETGGQRVALPKRLIRKHAKNKNIEIAKQLPSLLDMASDTTDQDLNNAEGIIKDLLGVERLETYYALIKLDGDKMGQILSGDPENSISYKESFHPKLRAGFDKHASREPKIAAYGGQSRALSPNRHIAISSALNDYSFEVASI